MSDPPTNDRTATDPAPSGTGSPAPSGQVPAAQDGSPPAQDGSPAATAGSPPAAPAARRPGRAASPALLAMAAPLIVSFWMRSLFSFVDTIYAATLGDAAVAAIGLSLPFEFLMIAIWVGLSNSLTSHLSRAMGAGEEVKILQYQRVAWRVVIGLVPVFTVIGVLCVLFADRIAPSGEVARQFAIYAGVLIVGSAFSVFWSVIPDSIVKAHHDTRSTMWAGIWSNVINVILNTIFTFVFHWGIFGIGLSTVIGRFGGLVYALGRARHHEAARTAHGTDTSPARDPSPYHTVLALALPSALTYTLMALEGGIINRFLKTLPNATEAIAAYAIQYRVLLFVMMPAIATAAAMLPYAARRFGERDIAGIRRGLRHAQLAAVGYTAACFPIIWFAADPVARALSHGETTYRFATFGLRIVPLACLVGIPFFLCRAVFEGLGHGRPGLVLAIVRYVLLTVPAAWIGILLAECAGVPGLYGLLLGSIVATALTSALFLVMVRRLLHQFDGRTP